MNELQEIAGIPINLPDDEPGPTGEDREKTYRVKAIFPTIQGEGYWAGAPAVFVRLVGCNLWDGRDEHRRMFANEHGISCPLWCDTDFTRTGSRCLTAVEVLEQVTFFNTTAEIVVLTGGEPLLQVDSELVSMLKRGGFQVHIETNGTVSLYRGFSERRELVGPLPDWITLSPKKHPDDLSLEFCHEYKLVAPDYILSPDWAEYAQEITRPIRHPLKNVEHRCLYVQPEDGPRIDESTKAALDFVQMNPGWRISAQTHKILGVE